MKRSKIISCVLQLLLGILLCESDGNGGGRGWGGWFGECGPQNNEHTDAQHDVRKVFVLYASVC